MTFEQIFSGRMVLMRAQRHIAQGAVRYETGTYLTPIFRAEPDERAFFLVERLLQDLEREFEEKRKRTRKHKRAELAERADRQVEQL